MLLAAVDVSIVAPAFVAGLLILATHVPLGQEVLKRGIIFMDLAIAQIASLGVIFASMLGLTSHGWAVQLLVVMCALVGAWILSLLEKYRAAIQEAAIGISFILASTASVLLLSNNPHGGEQLKDLLIGQILWTTWDQLIPLAVITFISLFLLFRANFKSRLGFYFVFAVAVTTAVQLVGVFLVFSSLIMPAMGSRLLEGKKRLLIGYVIGVVGYGMGLFVSSIVDLPSGAVIVWCLFLVMVLTLSLRSLSQEISRAEFNNNNK